jgi:hypothetical protein
MQSLSNEVVRVVLAFEALSVQFLRSFHDFLNAILYPLPVTQIVLMGFREDRQIRASRLAQVMINMPQGGCSVDETGDDGLAP